MSYLDVPRFHFAGEFYADPSTVDNMADNYDPTATIDNGWNPMGTHYFFFRNCTIKSALDASGTFMTTAADDDIIGGKVEVASSIAAQPKLVDLDTEWQNASQIWGMKVAISTSTGSSVEGVMETATLRDLWLARVPGKGVSGASGVFQSVLTGLVWKPPAGPTKSKVFNVLQAQNKLSIHFVTYAYDRNNASAKFKFGKLVGTVGPFLPDEPEHFVSVRRLEPGGKIQTVGSRHSAPFGHAPFKIDAARKKLIIDLGNAVPESAVAGARRALGAMRAQITIPPATAPTILGPIDYSQGHYETTAGVEEIALTAAQVTALDSTSLSISVDGLPGKPVVMAEPPSGTLLDATEIAFRLNPGEERTVELIASKFGKPQSGLDVSLRLQTGLSLTSAGLTFSALGSGKTGADGRIKVKFKGGDPKHPRPNIDGQLFYVDFDWGKTVAGTAPDRRGTIRLKVFDPFPGVASPKWADVKGILEEYARIYPMMKGRMDLSVHATVQANKDSIKTTLSYPETDPRYMPVSRDLSKDKRDLLLRWIGKGAP